MSDNPFEDLMKPRHSGASSDNPFGDLMTAMPAQRGFTTTTPNPVVPPIEQRVAPPPAQPKASDADYGVVDGLTDPQQYREAIKGFIPGAVSAAGSVLQSPDVIAAKGQYGAASLGKSQLAVMDRIDRGELVSETEDVLGYQHMGQEQRAAVRAELVAAQAAFNPTPVQDRAAFKAGEAVQQYAKGMFPAAPGYEQSVGRQLGEGGGSMAVGIPVSIVGGPIAAAGIYGGMGIGEATQRAVEYDRKEKSAGRPGLNQEQIITAGLLGVGPGATDVLPIETLIGRLPVPVPQALRAPLARGIAKIGTQAVIEGVQEGGQSFLQDLIAREVYNSGQVLGENFWNEAGIGGSVGGLAEAFKMMGAGMIRSAAGRRGGHAASSPTPTPESPPAVTPAPANRIEPTLPVHVGWGDAVQPAPAPQQVQTQPEPEAKSSRRKPAQLAQPSAFQTANENLALPDFVREIAEGLPAIEPDKQPDISRVQTDEKAPIAGTDADEQPAKQPATDPYAVRLVPTAQRGGVDGLVNAISGLSADEAVSAAKAQLGVTIRPQATEEATKAAVGREVFRVMSQRAAAAGAEERAAQFGAMAEDVAKRLGQDIKPQDILAAVQTAPSRLYHESRQMMRDVANFEKELIDRNASPAEIAREINARYGTAVTPEQIRSGDTWWKTASERQFESASQETPDWLVDVKHDEQNDENIPAPIDLNARPAVPQQIKGEIAGAPTLGPRLTPEMRQAAYELAQKGLPPRQIAERLTNQTGVYVRADLVEQAVADKIANDIKNNPDKREAARAASRNMRMYSSDIGDGSSKWTPDMVEWLGSRNVRNLTADDATRALNATFGTKFTTTAVNTKRSQLGYTTQQQTDWTPQMESRLVDLIGSHPNDEARTAALNAEFGTSLTKSAVSNKRHLLTRELKAQGENPVQKLWTPKMDNRLSELVAALPNDAARAEALNREFGTALTPKAVAVRLTRLGAGKGVGTDWTPAMTERLSELIESLPNDKARAEALNKEFETSLSPKAVKRRREKLREAALRRGGDEPMFAVSGFNPRGWLDWIKGKIDDRGEATAQAGRSSPAGSGEVSSQQPGASQTRGAGTEASADGGRGRIARSFDVRGLTARLIQAPPGPSGLREVWAFLHPAKAWNPKGKLDNVTRNVLKGVPNWTAKAILTEVAPGEWRLDGLQVRSNKQRGGLGTAFLDGIEQNLGATIAAPREMTPSLYGMWRKREMEGSRYRTTSVDDYVEWRKRYYSPDKIRDLKDAATEIAALGETSIERNVAKKQADELDELVAKLPPEDDILAAVIPFNPRGHGVQVDLARDAELPLMQALRDGADVNATIKAARPLLDKLRDQYGWALMQKGVPRDPAVLGNTLLNLSRAFRLLTQQVGEREGSYPPRGLYLDTSTRLQRANLSGYDEEFNDIVIPRTATPDEIAKFILENDLYPKQTPEEVAEWHRQYRAERAEEERERAREEAEQARVVRPLPQGSKGSISRPELMLANALRSNDPNALAQAVESGLVALRDTYGLTGMSNGWPSNPRAQAELLQPLLEGARIAAPTLTKQPHWGFGLYLDGPTGSLARFEDGYSGSTGISVPPGTTAEQFAKFLRDEKIIPVGQAPLAAVGAPLSVPPETNARREAGKSLRSNKIARVDPDVVNRVLDRMRKSEAMFPEGMPLGVVESIAPYKNFNDKDVARVTFRLTDGSTAYSNQRWSLISGIRNGLWQAIDPAGNTIHIVAAFRFDLAGYGDKVFRGELGHENVHALRRSGHLGDLLIGRLARHSDDLRVMDMGLKSFLTAIDHPDKIVDDNTPLIDIYQFMTKGRADRDDIIAQEKVSHLLELYVAGAVKVDPNVAQVLDSILDGRMARGEQGGQGELAQRLAKEGKDTLFAVNGMPGGQPRSTDSLGYYSHALEAARSLKQAKGTPEQMLAQLKSAGVKDAEIEATGLRSFIASKKSVTKDEIVQHLESNRVGVREGMYSADPDVPAPPPKWHNYSLDPSNPSYRETVLHLPTWTELADQAVAAVREKHGIKPHEGWGKYATAEERAHIERLQDRAIEDDGKPTFQSGHFSEPNIVGHMMTSMVKHEGKPVYLIDQIQSDWGQKLRDGGVRDEAKIAELKRKHDEAGQAWVRDPGLVDLDRKAKALVGDAYPLGHNGGNKFATVWEGILQLARDNNQPQGLREQASNLRLARNSINELYEPEVRRLQAELRTMEGASPGHPLVNTTDQWVNTTLRRAIRQAAEAGADYIAIPSGDTVLSYNPGDGDGMEGFYGSNSNPRGAESLRREIADVEAGRNTHLDIDYLKKRLAVAEQGMEGIVPKNLRKLLAKIDKDSPKPSKIEKVQTPSGMKGFGFTLFPLTQKVKDAVLNEGQPLFANGGRVLSRASGGRITMPKFDDSAIDAALDIIRSNRLN